MQRQQTAATELAKRKFFIPAARTLMGAIYDSKYLSNANLVNTAELVKVLEDDRDVQCLSVAGRDAVSTHRSLGHV